MARWAARVAMLVASVGLMSCGADGDAGAADASNGQQSDGQISVDGSVAKCTVDADCKVASVCRVASCQGGFCLEQAAPDGAPCEDGDPCTGDDGCQGGACVGKLVCECNETADCADKEDGDPCNGTLICDKTGDAPKCVVNPATVKTCPPGDVTCQPEQCDPADGSCKPAPAPDGTACDDGLPCSQKDACEKGTCKGDISGCGCKVDSDCEDDGNPCNGTLYCDTTGDTWTCKVNEASVVVCPSGDGAACEAPACNPKNGKCEIAPKADGASCDVDGSPCSLDQCAKGACTPGKLDPQCKCTKNADCAAWEDATVCNGTLYCNLAMGVCDLNPSTVVTCGTGQDTPCRQNQCDPKTGACKLTDLPAGFPCDDGFDCTQGEGCKDGVCAVDKQGCQCTTSKDCDKYAAANACVGAMYCNKPEGVCKPNPATVVVCSSTDDTTCLKNTCNTKTGACKPAPANEGKPCEADNNWCTSVDICQEGKCQPADNQCPCKSDADCAAKDDGNACNGTLYCDIAKKACVAKPNSAVVCTGGTSCTPNACDPTDGKCKPTALPDNTPCNDDGFVCSNDVCLSGKCQQTGNNCLCWEDTDCAPFEDGDACNGTLYCDKTAGPPSCKLNPKTVKTCAAALPGSCTVAVCDPKDGQCKAQPGNEGKGCNDADPCTESDSCKGGTCAGVDVPKSTCDDKNVCTADACKAGTGCTHTPAPGSCTDGSKCTANAACSGGKCVSTQPVNCDDGKGCTIDSCDPKSGCVHAAKTGASCDDGDACTGTDQCQADGSCLGKVATPCDDSKPCTTDSCDPKTGCVHAPATGPTCDDGDACTTGDACASGACKGGAPKSCTTSEPCKVASCDPKNGCVVAAGNAGKTCDAGKCNEPGTCAKGSCVPGKVKSCDDGEVCTKDSCSPLSGCISLPVLGSPACSDANACGATSVCQAGKCVAPSDDLLSPLKLLTNGNATVDDVEQIGLGVVAVIARDAKANASVLSYRDATGKRWSVQVDKPANFTGTHLRHVVASPSNSKEWIVCGEGTVAGKSGQLFLSRIDISSGKTLTAKAVTHATASGSCDDLVTAGADVTYLSGGKGYVCNVATQGGFANCATIDKTHSDLVAVALQRAGQNTTVALGYRPLAGGKRQPWFARVNDDDMIVDNYLTVSPTGGKDTPTALVAKASGDAMLFGYTTVGTTDTPWAVFVNSDNEVGKKLVLKNDFKGAILGAAEHHNGAIAIVGRYGTGTAAVGFYGLMQTQAGYFAMRELTLGDYGAALGVQMIPGGGAVVAGSYRKGTARTTYMMDLNKESTPTCLKTGSCGGAPSGKCDDGKPCTLDACDPAKGCVSTPLFQGAFCDDGKLCVVDSTCNAAGSCGGGDPKVCDDGNPCTKDACDPKSGCVTTALTGAVCNDGDSCTVGDQCKSGTCTGAPNKCSDGDACTTDTCDSVKGCLHSYNGPGSLCIAGQCVDVEGQKYCEKFGGSKSVYLQVAAQGGVYRDSKGDNWGWGFPPGYQTHANATGPGPHKPYKIQSLPAGMAVMGNGGAVCALDSQGTATCTGWLGGKYQTVTLQDSSGKPAPPLSSIAGPRGVGGNNSGLWGVTLTKELWTWKSGSIKGTKLGSGVVQVQVNQEHACAITAAGKVRCWGKEIYQQLGNGSDKTDKTFAQATDVASVTGARHLCTGRYHTCASNGSKLWCWGRSTEGQIGNGSSVTKDAPVEITKPAGFVTALACNQSSTCAILSGKAYCWGKNDLGQLGLGHTKRVTTITTPTLANAVAISGAREHFCGMDGNDVVRCWGVNTGGLQLTYTKGQDGDPLIPSTPKALGGLVIVDYSGSTDTTLFRDAKTQEVYCFGENAKGQCGVGSMAEQNLATPKTVFGLVGSDVVGGGEHNCAAGDAFACWGDNFYGQVNPGNPKTRVLSPEPLQLPDLAIQGCAGEDFTCAALDNGKVACWGRNSSFQVGNPTAGNKGGLNVISGLPVVNRVECGYSTACARDAGGKLYCWGNNSAGQLGDGTVVSRHTAKIVSGGLTFTDFGGGIYQTCALEKTKGDVYCWGGKVGFVNYIGNPLVHSKLPVKVPGITGAKGLVVGDYVTCARLADNTLRCWGTNSSGGLGDGTGQTPSKGAPVEPKGLGAVSAFWVSGRTACAKQVSSGKVLCWGGESKPTSGVGTWGSISPVQVAP